jgi:hypothetical protein
MIFFFFFFAQASLETFFGLGLIVGPMVGGALYAVSVLFFEILHQA